MEDSADEDEILQQHTQLLDDLDDLPSQLPIQTEIGTRAGTGSSTQHADPQKEGDQKKRETCRFFARGHCTRNKDCRFEHPNICKKFRQFGSISTDKSGCDGKCEAFHPNACQNSLKDKTCLGRIADFFTLKVQKEQISAQMIFRIGTGKQTSNQMFFI